MSSATPCPTDTAPLGRTRQAWVLDLLFLTPVCWQACSILQPWLLWLSTNACQRPSRARASLEAVRGWCMGGGWGQPHPWGLERTVVQTSSPAVLSQLRELVLVRRHLLALCPSVCAPGQACLVLSRTLSQLQASMTYFLCITPSSSLCVKRTAPLSPAKDRIGSLTLCFLYLGGSELVETQTLLANVRVHNPGHRDI